MESVEQDARKQAIEMIESRDKWPMGHVLFLCKEDPQDDPDYGFLQNVDDLNSERYNVVVGIYPMIMLEKKCLRVDKYKSAQEIVDDGWFVHAPIRFCDLQ